MYNAFKLRKGGIGYLNFIYKPEGEIRLADILIPRKSRKGYGKALVQTLFEIAKKKRIVKIYGKLASEDAEHREEQIAFYEKLGFDVDRNDDSIKKILTYETDIQETNILKKIWNAIFKKQS